jgi:hypothetical protein
VKGFENRTCATCEKAGVVHKAHRIMPDGRALCDEHYRAESGLPPLGNNLLKEWKGLPEKKMDTMPKPAEPIDWDAVQKERDSGVSVSAIAAKYKISEPTVYNHTKTKRVTIAATVKEAQESFRKPKLIGGFSDADIIANLEKRRDEYLEKAEKLEKAIEALSGI